MNGPPWIERTRIATPAARPRTRRRRTAGRPGRGPAGPGWSQSRGPSATPPLRPWIESPRDSCANQPRAKRGGGGEHPDDEDDRRDPEPERQRLAVPALDEQRPDRLD